MSNFLHKYRYGFERFFQSCGILALAVAGLLLVILISAVSFRGLSAFQHYEMLLTISPQTLNQIQADIQDASVADANVTDASDYDTNDYDEGDNEIDYNQILKNALGELFPQVQNNRQERRELLRFLPSARAYEQIKEDISLWLKTHPQAKKAEQPLHIWVSLSDQANDFLKINDGAGGSTLPAHVQNWIAQLKQNNLLREQFHFEFFTNGDSRDPEHAGINTALISSLWLMLITFLLSFPIGVLAAIYLQEFAPKNWLSDLIEININNLASVPSIIFGLMGLALFLNWFGLPRSSPLVGGMVLSLMTLPTIIISTRASLATVPPSIREASLAIGATHMQSIFHHVLPLALPGILTGAIISMARALGETAPLLMIGMVAFIAQPPNQITDPASGLPVQIYLWSDSPERSFADKASAAIIILLVFLMIMNGLAIYLRKKFTHKW